LEWGSLRSTNTILEHPNPVNADANQIAMSQGKIITRHNARPGHQVCAMREAVVPKKIADQLLKLALDLRQSRAAAEGRLSFPLNFKADGCALRQRLLRKQNRRPNRAASVIDFRLRQIQRVLAFNIPRAHIVSDGVPDNLTRRIRQQR